MTFYDDVAIDNLYNYYHNIIYLHNQSLFLINSITKDNKVQKDGFTNRERAGEYGTRKPEQPKKTTEKEGDPKEAIRFMNAAGLHGLADMYETNYNATKEGKAPPLFANNKFFAGVKLVPEGQSADTKATATVGDTGGPTAQDFINAAPEAMNYKATQTNYVAEQLEKSKYDPEKLPMPNILHDFASYNNLFSFGCLSAEELNYPDKTYRKNGLYCRFFWYYEHCILL